MEGDAAAEWRHLVGGRCGFDKGRSIFGRGMVGHKVRHGGDMVEGGGRERLGEAIGHFLYFLILLFGDWWSVTMVGVVLCGVNEERPTEAENWAAKVGRGGRCGR